MPTSLVIAHRGHSARYPEHTRGSFLGALDAGADLVEVDLVPCADGVLVARHDWGLSATTDIADRPGIGEASVDRLPSTIVAGLLARERWPRLRPGSAARDRRWPVPSLVDLLGLAVQEASRRGRSVGLALEVKDVARAERAGLDVVAALLADLARTGLPRPDVPVWVMAFEAAPLARLAAERDRGDAPPVGLVQLVEGSLPTTKGWDGIAARAEVVGVSVEALLPSTGAVGGVRAAGEAHRRGLALWTWTLRAENAFLPPALRRGDDPAAYGRLDVLVEQAVSLGAAGLVGDQPDVLRALVHGLDAVPPE